MKVEYKVRPVTRYVVTEFNQYDNGQQSKIIGEFDNFGMSNQVCAALAYDRHNNRFDKNLKVYYSCYSPDYQLDDISVLVNGNFDNKIENND